MKRLLLLICAMLPIVCMAQTRVVRGIVYDTNDIPMVGITVSAVNSSDSTKTTDGGNFELSVSQYERYIEVKEEGYFTTRAEVDGSFLIIHLKYDKKYWDNKAKAEAEAKKAEEAAKLAEQQRLEAERIAAEEAAVAKAKAEEEARIAEQRRLEAERLAAEKAAAAKAKAEEEARIAEQRRLEAERLAAEKAAAAKAKAEEEARIAEQRRLEAERLAAEKAAAAKAKAEEKARIAEQRRLEAERLAAEKAASKAKENTNAINDMTAITEGNHKGFGSIVELSTMIGLGNRFSNSSIRYIAGYKCNNNIYIGAGTGANLNYYGTPLSYDDSLLDSGQLTPKIFSIPLFAFFRANFIDRPFSPFFALAAGFNFSPKQILHLKLIGARYSTSAPFVNPQVGINFRVTNTTSAYFAVGFQCMAIPSCVNYTLYNATFKPIPGYGVDIHLGFTF